MTITDYAPIMAFIANLLTLLQHGHTARLKSKASLACPLGPLTYRLTVDIPAPARSSPQSIGLTPCKFQSGEIKRTGAISRCGDEMMRQL
jgi:transposase